MANLWGRQVFVRVGPPGGLGVELRDLRIDFTVEHDQTAGPAKATISVWNPRRETVAYFEDPEALVRLYAGYDTPRQIFQGNPEANGVKVERRGAERILSVTARDGLRVYQDTQVDITLAAPTNLPRLVAEVRRQMGVAQGPSFDLPADIDFPEYTYHGDAHALLDRLVTMAGGSWHIRDGALVLVKDGESTGEVAPVYSASAGNLVGAPSRKDGGVVEVRALLDSSIRPGMPFQLESEELNGLYVADTVKFMGSSGYGRDFYVVILGRERATN